MDLGGSGGGGGGFGGTIATEEFFNSPEGRQHGESTEISNNLPLSEHGTMLLGTGVGGGVMGGGRGRKGSRVMVSETGEADMDTSRGGSVKDGRIVSFTSDAHTCTVQTEIFRYNSRRLIF